MRTRGDAKTQRLSQHPLFADCSRRELLLTAALGDVTTRPAGTVLATAGALGRELFVILAGSVAVSREGHRLATLGQGSFVGEMALLERRPRSATVVAETPVELFVVDDRDLTRLLEHVPVVARRMLAELSRRLSAANDCTTAGYQPRAALSAVPAAD